jgi:hypothetical protein
MNRVHSFQLIRFFLVIEVINRRIGGKEIPKGKVLELMGKSLGQEKRKHKFSCHSKKKQSHSTCCLEVLSAQGNRK